MTIWEKVVVNIERGAQKITAGAALFSDRVRAEISLARLRIRRDDVRSSIAEQERIIGRKFIELTKEDELPRTSEQLLKDEDILAALSEIVARERDLEDIQNEILKVQEAFKPVNTPGQDGAL
ncbi:MAG: hypothetical protein A2010_03185 [Nitrospirae bacterium GWD2_57_9]|nr:MAG: hypothetical protein A2010_03185 [Nitrospirae bacterium GWD2_57_9]